MHDDGKKKLPLYCFITALCVKMDIFLSEHILSLKYTPNNDMKVILVNFLTVIVAAWYREKSCQLQNSPCNLVSGGCQFNQLLCTCIDITSIYIEAKVFSKN